MGFTCYEATTGESALRSWQKIRPDIVILDIGLSGPMDGLHVLAQARTMGFTRTKVLMLTGKEELGKRSFELGAQGFFIKPVRLGELKARLEFLMREALLYEADPRRVNYRLRIRNGQPVQISLPDVIRLKESVQMQSEFKRAVMQSNSRRVSKKFSKCQRLA